ALRELARAAAGGLDAPDVATVDVADVRGVVQVAPVRRQPHELHLALTRRELDGLGLRILQRDAVPVPPVPGLRREDQVLAPPAEPGETGEGGVARLVVPRPPALPRLRVRDPQLEGVASAEARLEHAGQRIVCGAALRPAEAATLPLTRRHFAEAQARPPLERDALAGGRPHGVRIPVHTARQVDDA